MEGVGEELSRGGLGGNWDPGSLTETGDALFPFGLDDLCSDMLSILVSLFETIPGTLVEDKDLWDVATSASLSATEELCRVSLCVKTRIVRIVTQY